MLFGWCSWLSRQSNTLEVTSSILVSNTFLLKYLLVGVFFLIFCFLSKAKQKQRSKKKRDVLELNQRPIGLQPIALPLS